MRKQLIPLLLAVSFCLPALFFDLIPTWNPHSVAASQDKTTAAEVAAAIEEQKQEAAKMARSQLAEQKIQELNAKARLNGTAPVIVKLRVAFRPEGELLSAAQVQAQRAVINQTQDSLMKGLTGYDPASLKRYEYSPYLAVRVNEAGLESLRLAPDVIDIHEDELFRTALEESVPITGAPYAWSDGYTGGESKIAILDTGVDRKHPFFSTPGYIDLFVPLPQIAGLGQPYTFHYNRIVSEACYSTNDTTAHASSLCPGGVSESTAVDSGLNCAGLSGCEHGTHVAGIAAGNGGRLSGVAKGASLISIQVFSRIDDPAECDGAASCIRSFTSDLIRPLERVYTLRDTYSIASVNMSLGSGRFTSNCDTNPLKSIIDQLRSAGIATVIASGDDGYTDAISSPACISSAISVGATGDGTRLAADQVAPYSNSASFLNLLAPGDFITSSIPGGGFAAFSGTSMAAPHVAGGVALLKERYPTASVTELLNLLTSRGFPITDTRNGVTLPRLYLGPPPDCIATNVPADHWMGWYYRNTELTGLPVMVRDDGAGFLNFDIGDGSPGGNCDPGADNFSVGWVQTVNFTAGIYRFTVTADDGVELIIDERTILYNWNVQETTTYTVDVFLPTGSHRIELLHFEAAGDTVAKLSWAPVDSGNCIADVPADHWRPDHYGLNLLAVPMMVRDHGAGYLDLDFGVGSPSPACGVGADNFPARRPGIANFAPGAYRFSVTADDGVKLYIDGLLVIYEWRPQTPTTYTANVFLPAGSHEIKLEYYDAGGAAAARLSWEALNNNCYEGVLPVDHWIGEYFGPPIHNNTGLDLLMLRDDGVGFLNFDFGDGSPSAACGVGADNFHVRWTRMVNFAPGGYRFSVTADGRVNLYVDGKTVIDNKLSDAPTTYTGDVILPAGSHQISLWYYDDSAGAVDEIPWESMDANNSPVAFCQNVTVQAGAGCVADASINNGSFDPDGDPITITQTPAGPYPVGATSVLLTVTDSSGASSQCSSTVTVQAPTTTTVSTPPPVQSGAVVTLSSTTIAQNCPAPTLTGSVEFFVNNVSVGSAPVNSSGVATKNAQILLAAGSYPVKAVFTSSNPFIQTSMGTSTLTVMNRPPVAMCKNVTVQAGAGCVANASINDGSFDPDGDPLTITQTPAGPYPVGATNVVLTVTDSRGATSQCSSTVTVQAPTTTTVSTPSPVQYSDVGALSSTTVAQNCPAPTAAGSVEFFVNNVSVGAAPVSSSGVATKNAQILPAAGSYPVRAVFTGSIPSILSSMGT